MSGLESQFIVSLNSVHGKMRKISTFDGKEIKQSISAKRILVVLKVTSTVKVTLP